MRRNCTLRQDVTVGTRQGDHDVPILGDGVEIGAGRILGSVRIGSRVSIGANAVVLDDVPDHHIAVRVPTRPPQACGIGEDAGDRTKKCRLVSVDAMVPILSNPNGSARADAGIQDGGGKLHSLSEKNTERIPRDGSAFSGKADPSLRGRNRSACSRPGWSAGLAILLVLMLHFYQEGGEKIIAAHYGSLGAVLQKPILCGWVGVNLFFVLSGFLITDPR